ncbi:MAG: hypothetical protein LBM18_00955 [Oscillospiraceae bacterium]|jgi:dextranase|nr:hypothetical protein [Oscillospiraceae bacterium]
MRDFYESYLASGEPRGVIRYGFLSDFAPGDEDPADIESMARLHINAVQFYDWSYRHDDLVAPTQQYSDMMGKRNDLAVVREKIRQCHEQGMLALAYGAVYAASADYQRQHPEQSLYSNEGEPLCFIDTFYIMNPSRGNPWRNHILEEYRRTMDELGFDGIHMDTYGWPKAAFDFNGQPVYLEDEFPSLIDEARKIKLRSGAAPFIIFNNVGGWPVSKTMLSAQQAVYIEVWPPYERYFHLGMLISEAKKSGKPVILAAYPAPFRTDAPRRALECQLILSFVIGMHGASQLFFGEENGVVTQGYYADYSRLDLESVQAIRAYQDFLTQLEPLLTDPTMEDVSLTHQGWDNKEFVFTPEGSADGEGGKIWYHLRQNRRRKAIYMVNLQNNNSLWNEGKNPPACDVTVTMQIQMLKKPKAVWFASPDKMQGAQQPVHYELSQTAQSLTLHLDVQLFRSGVVVVEEL